MATPVWGINSIPVYYGVCSKMLTVYYGTTCPINPWLREGGRNRVQPIGSAKKYRIHSSKSYSIQASSVFSKLTVIQLLRNVLTACHMKSISLSFAPRHHTLIASNDAARIFAAIGFLSKIRNLLSPGHNNNTTVPCVQNWHPNRVILAQPAICAFFCLPHFHGKKLRRLTAVPSIPPGFFLRFPKWCKPPGISSTSDPLELCGCNRHG